LPESHLDIPLIEKLCRYKKIYHLWDNDATGEKNSKLLNHLSTPLFIEKEVAKDLTAAYQKKGRNYCLDFFKKKLIDLI
jgi:5S rRNA maturation endonuclease (ribonuclease M5)